MKCPYKLWNLCLTCLTPLPAEERAIVAVRGQE